jgi:hypothetical protein
VATTWSDTIDFAGINNTIISDKATAGVGRVTVEGYSEFTGGYSNRANITANQFVFDSGFSSSAIYIGVPKGTTQAQAGALLAGKRIIYQLANPVITELLPEPLKSSPKGSIIYENVRREIGTYGTNAAVSDTAIPIKAMRKLYKVLADGTKIPLSVISGITIAGDKLSFTHTGLVNGDSIEWEYEFDSALSTTPLIEYSYVNDADDFPATNLVNGDFEDANTTIGAGWIPTGSPTFSKDTTYFMTGTKSQKIVTVSADNGIRTNSILVSGRVYYCSVWVKNETGANVYLKTDARTLLSATVTNNVFTKVSTLFTASPSDQRWHIDMANATTYYIDDAMLLDLTAIFANGVVGTGKEPSKESIDAIMALYPNSWFDGTVNPLIGLKDMWNLLAPKISEAWITPTLLNSFVYDTVPVSYRKNAIGKVTLRGIAKTGAAGSTVFTLGSGYRPSVTVIIGGYNGQQRIVINTDGTVVASVYTTLCLFDGIEFYTD